MQSQCFLTASFLGPTLPDVLSAIVSIICLIGLLKVWQPAEVWRFPKERTEAALHPDRLIHSLSELIRAWMPFILLVIFVGNWGIPGIQTILGKATAVIPFGILNNAIISNGNPLSISYSFTWLGAAGTSILFAAIIDGYFLASVMERFLASGMADARGIVQAARHYRFYRRFRICS